MPTEPRNTYLFRWGQSFVPRCPIDHRVHRLKKIYFFPPVQFVRNGSPCEWKTTFSDVPFFFSSSLSNELFFIRRQRYAISPPPPPPPFFVIDFYSFANFFLLLSLSFFFYYFSLFPLLPFPLCSLIPPRPPLRPSLSLVRHGYHPRLVSLLPLFFCTPFSLLSSLLPTFTLLTR